MENKENLDLHIDGYDDKHIFSYDMKIWMDWYVKRLKQILKGNNCLELGIGHGYTTNTFSSFFNDYEVIEGSQQMIERFFNLFPLSKVKIELGYFEDFEPTKKYDVILMGYVLEHVDNPKEILNKYKQYLTEKGSIFVVVPNGSSLNRRFGLKSGYLKSLDEMSEFDYKCGHKRTFTYESLIQLVKECDLEIEKQEGIFLKCMTTQQMLDLNLSDAIINSMCEVAIDYPELAACILLELKNN
ncbi:MAG: class I SAM-dependent methyltransferase [Bacteroidetes bacterium]|nr:class I SAM-dependent methyltransferase [Bacteroidota bacterium]